MINLRSFFLTSTLILVGFTTNAQDYSSATGTYTSVPPSGGSGSDSATAHYLKNLGAYLGYKLDTDTAPTPIETMLDYTLSIVATGQQELSSLLAAIPVNSYFGSFTYNTIYDTFNNQASSNNVFSNYGAANASGVSTVDNFDQKTYQKDPVSQSILNLLGTPDWTSCTYSPNTSSSDACLSIDKVMTTVLQDITSKDKLPAETNYFKYENNAKFISQLNSNNLISPLLYSDQKAGSNQASQGLPSASQMQQAQDFIRYATGEVIPIDTMKNSDYGTLFGIAYPPTKSDGSYSSDVDLNNVMNARIALAKYLLNMRIYASKNSVVNSNLYYILGKRMPQNTNESGGSGTTTSQALNEFKMATWRQYDPNKSANEQWAQKINTSSPATIQKEIAILLSEISYQLYLNRQEQERILLTENILLAQILSSNKPDVDIPGNVDTGSPSTED